MWIDSHAHLFDLSDSRLHEILDNAHAAGVTTLVNTAVSIETSRTIFRQIDTMSNHPVRLFAAAGISPFDVEGPPDSWPASLDTLLEHPACIAVGETGLDTTHPRYPSLALQRQVFEQQCLAARAHDVPVIMHSRGAEEEVLETCRRLSIVKAVFHCYTGPASLVPRILEAGYCISYSGIITFKNGGLDRQLDMTPLDRLLIETDTPYLAPVPFRGKVNEPSLLIHTAAYAAARKNCSSAELSRALQQNFTRLFGR